MCPSFHFQRPKSNLRKGFSFFGDGGSGDSVGGGVAFVQNSRLEEELEK